MRHFVQQGADKQAQKIQGKGTAAFVPEVRNYKKRNQ